MSMDLASRPAIRRRRRTRKSEELVINAQAQTSIRLLAEAHSGLSERGAKIKPTISDLIKVSLKHVVASTKARPFSTDTAALRYMREAGFVVNIPEEDIDRVWEIEQEMSGISAATQPAHAPAPTPNVEIPPVLRGVLTPEILQKLTEISEAGVEEVELSMPHAPASAQIEFFPGEFARCKELQSERDISFEEALRLVRASTAGSEPKEKESEDKND